MLSEVSLATYHCLHRIMCALCHVNSCVAELELFRFTKDLPTFVISIACTQDTHGRLIFKIISLARRFT